MLRVHFIVFVFYLISPGETLDSDTSLDSSENSEGGLGIPVDLRRSYNNELKGEESIYKLEYEKGDLADLFGVNKHRFIPSNYQDFGKTFRSADDGNVGVTSGEAAEKLSYEVAVEETDQKKTEPDINSDPAPSTFWRTKEESIVPRKASPEEVLKEAEISRLLYAASPPKTYMISKKALRSGDYWNDIWAEDIKHPAKILRSEPRTYAKQKSKAEESSDGFSEAKLARLIQAVLSPQSSKTTPKAGEPFSVMIMPRSKLYKFVATKKSPKFVYIVNKNY